MTDESSQVRADQVKQLYDRAPLGMIASVINAIALSYVLWRVVPPRSLISWLACLFLVTLVRAIQVYLYRLRPPSLAEARTSEAQFIIGLAVSGIVWGAAALFLFPVDSLTHQVFLAFILGGMVAGAAATFSITKTA
ncbi:MAG TPA: hypothetical protein VLX12_10300, partial [Syntrophorhabdales bacterium]|nr:hypothetical protein [Syntrophorhabdales bacterium]